MVAEKLNLNNIALKKKTNKNTIQQNLKLTWLQLSMYFFCIYIIYGKSLSLIGYQYGRLSLILLTISLFMLLMYDKKILINRFIFVEFILLVVTSLTSLLVVESKNELFNVISIIFNGLVIGYILIRIAIIKKNIDFVVYAWIISAIILSLYIIWGGATLYHSGRFSISEDYNVNTLGVFIMFSVWCVVYIFSKKKKPTVISILGLVVLITIFLYVIMLTASRKALMGCIFIILYWGILCLKPYLKRMLLIKKIVLISVAAFTIFIIAQYYGNFFINESINMQNRFLQLSAQGITDDTRMHLIKDAIKVFLEHPIIGVGWNNYKFYSIYSMYSHCSYVEVLACTGIVGSIFAYYLLLILCKGVLSNKYNIEEPICHNMNLLLLLLFLFNSTMQIVFYNSNLLMIMHVIAATIMIKKPSIKEQRGMYN